MTTLSRKDVTFKKHLNLPMKNAHSRRGSVWQPAILWFLGAPTGLVILLWLFFFRGK